MSKSAISLLPAAGTVAGTGACYMGDGEPEMAQGITLGELAQMVQVIQIKQASETEERQAVQTICRTETNLFHSLVEQINGGRSRVAELLQKHEILRFFRIFRFKFHFKFGFNRLRSRCFSHRFIALRDKYRSIITPF